MKIIQRESSEASFILDLKACDIESILHQTVNHVVAQRHLPADRHAEVEKALPASASAGEETDTPPRRESYAAPQTIRSLSGQECQV